MDEEKITEENIAEENISEEAADDAGLPEEAPGEENSDAGEMSEESQGTSVDKKEPAEEKTAGETDGSSQKTVRKDAKKELYIYDADDEPVDDRDLYRDYTGDIFTSVPHSGAGTAAASGVQKKQDISLQQFIQTPVSQPVNMSAHQPANMYVPQSVQYVPDRGQAHRQYGAGAAQTEKASGRNSRHSDNMSNNPEKERQTSGRISISVINTVISMITLCVAAAGVFTALAYMRTHEQQFRADQTRIDHVEQKLNDITTENKKDGDYVDAISLIDKEEKNEPAVPDDEAVDVERGKIITYDSYVGYSWVPVLSGVKTNTYDKSAFVVDDENRLSYKPGGEVSSYFGIDVSSHQGDIDWNAARADGVEFAIIRIGVRGYGEEGNIKLDEKFFENYEGARDAGIDIGVYFYSQAISVEEAVEEAKFVLEQLGGRDLEYPVAFDWEPVDTLVDDTKPRTEEVMPGTFNLSARAFCETIEDAGYKAMIYTNKKMAYLKYDLRLFEGYPVWLALYNTDMTYYYDFDIWQYGLGKVAGIKGDVDVNIAIIR